MFNKLKIIIIMIFLLSLVHYGIEGQIRRSIYSDIKAHKIGDLLTIIINERTTSLNRSDASTSKQNQMSIDNSAGIGILDFLTGFGAESETQNQFQGNAQVTSTGQFSSTMSVRIQKILEDGNYLISGTRVVDTNGEMQVTELTGVVRPLDISSDNTILSSQIADIHIYHKGKGIVEQGHRPGIFTRIINWIF